VDIAHANRDIQQAGEPPLLEWATCAAYWSIGHEDLRIPRAISAISWVLGVIPLFGIARRFVSPFAAVVAAAVYLFLPYAIVATRSFQPDAFMTMWILWAVWATLRYHERPGPGRLAAAALLIGAALLVKPMSVFLVVPATIALGLTRDPGTSFRIRPATWLILAVGFLPALAYYGHSMVFGRLAQDQFQTRFVPSLLPTSFFWRGWWTQIGRVLGAPVFFVAVAGVVLTRAARLRWLMIAFGLGYAAFAVAFTYHVPTHDYYHLPYVFVGALGVAAAFDRVTAALSPRSAAATMVSVVAAVVLWGTWTAMPRLSVRNAAAIVADYQRIGEATQHDGRVLFLDLEYGYPLMYHAEVAGDTWPGVDDLNAEAMDGRAALTAEARFTRDFADWRPNYFVVTDLHSLREEKDLQALLAARTTLVEETKSYKVYRFRAP
jgi:4-amino-4-deoxy-L-arabinose transferase-like glycosyltransferase